MKTLGKITVILLLIVFGIAMFTEAATLLSLPSTIANICGGIVLLCILVIIYAIYKIINIKDDRNDS